MTVRTHLLGTRLLGTLLVAVTLVSAACSTAGSGSVPGLGAQAAPTTATSAPPATAPAGGQVQCDPGKPTQSLKPTPLPPPGQMPAGTFMKRVQDAGHLVVGVDQTTYLFGYLNPTSGAIEGFDIDMLKQVSKAIFGDENRIQYVAVTSAQRIPYVQQGKVDIVARTMTINCTRWQQVDFSTEYYHADQRVLVPANSSANGLQQGMKVCATRGSTSVDNISKAGAQPVQVAEWTDCLAQLQHGTVDAVSTDDSILAGLKAQDPYTKVVGAPFAPQPYGMAISKDHPEFVQFVNAVLDQMRANGTWVSLYDRWIGRLFPNVATPPPPVALYFP
jgi:polar amino acid transport system substrate-binding protein